ncbi:hypothetical protein [Butyrivibrio sp. WCD2001]|uniref:hypothetical protein n=1 Tax=Butyrivibrio sp. WCD2001 TaxID=1280681 RepID=UPI0003FE7E4C|nr:hypothetical protein [Butyrivibrio sp. WCD2001]
MKKIIRIVAAVMAGCLMLSSPSGVYAAKNAKEFNTNINHKVYASGSYINWEGVSNVSEFTDENGDYCFAYCKGKTVTVVRNKNGKVKSKKKIKMQYPIFGAVSCDQEGNLYVVSGRKNNSSDQTKNTVFITKYSKNGQFLAAVGDNGSGCFQKYSERYGYSSSTRDTDSNTKIPFEAGNCDVAINGNYLAVNYGRGMYNGHQSNTALIINRNTMQLVQLDRYYNSHSFAQRAIPYQDGFILASEGDAYNRSFSVGFTTPSETVLPPDEKAAEESAWSNYDAYAPAYKDADKAAREYTTSGYSSVRNYDIFHFWIKKNSAYNMYVVNNNYAHMGGVAVADNNHVALVGTSVKNLDKKAAKQKECLFIQIFDPTQSLKSENAFTMKTTRSGKSGIAGTQDVTDYGVKWLTNGSFTVSNPQVTADAKGRFVILFEKYVGGSYKGVYYMVINNDGKVAKKAKLFSATAYLNPCETPKTCGNYIYWTSNRGGSSNLHTYRLKVK